MLSDVYDPTLADRLSKQQHRDGVYKGMAAVLGLYVFFVVESLLKLRHAKRAKVSHVDFFFFLNWDEYI